MEGSESLEKKFHQCREWQLFSRVFGYCKNILCSDLIQPRTRVSIINIFERYYQELLDKRKHQCIREKYFSLHLDLLIIIFGFLLFPIILECRNSFFFCGEQRTNNNPSEKTFTKKSEVLFHNIAEKLCFDKAILESYRVIF